MVNGEWGRTYQAGARGRRRTGKLLGVTYELFEAGQKVKSFITEVDCSLETALTESMEARMRTVLLLWWAWMTMLVWRMEWSR